MEGIRQTTLRKWMEMLILYILGSTFLVFNDYLGLVVPLLATMLVLIWIRQIGFISTSIPMAVYLLLVAAAFYSSSLNVGEPGLSFQIRSIAPFLVSYAGLPIVLVGACISLKAKLSN